MSRISQFITDALRMHMIPDCARIVSEYAIIRELCYLECIDAWMVFAYGFFRFIPADGVNEYVSIRGKHFGISGFSSSITTNIQAHRRPTYHIGCTVCGRTTIGIIENRHHSKGLYLCASCWSDPVSIMWIGSVTYHYDDEMPGLQNMRRMPTLEGLIYCMTNTRNDAADEGSYATRTSGCEFDYDPRAVCNCYLRTEK